MRPHVLHNRLSWPCTIQLHWDARHVVSQPDDHELAASHE